jgi:hypothetical protein
MILKLDKYLIKSKTLSYFLSNLKNSEKNQIKKKYFFLIKIYF